jgi:hypothetical protein
MYYIDFQLFSFNFHKIMERGFKLLTISFESKNIHSIERSFLGITDTDKHGIVVDILFFQFRQRQDYIQGE